MLNIGAGEITLIIVIALLVLGPQKLPELARGIGKFVREFRRQTDEVRGVVEREFYRMDQELEAPQPKLPEGALAANAKPDAHEGLHDDAGDSSALAGEHPHDEEGRPLPAAASGSEASSPGTSAPEAEPVSGADAPEDPHPKSPADAPVKATV